MNSNDLTVMFILYDEEDVLDTDGAHQTILGKKNTCVFIRNEFKTGREKETFLIYALHDGSVCIYLRFY